MMSNLAFVWSLLFVIWCFSFPAAAHELRPAYLEVRETKTGSYDVLWKVPGRGDNLRLSLYVQVPEGCDNISEPRGFFADNAFVERWTMRCPGGLAGRRIHIIGLAATLTDVLARLERFDGTAQVVRLMPSEPSFVVEAAPRRMQVAATYLKLGIEHILTGIDHLLFVLALIIITRGGWKLVKTVSAFTVSHSITLTAATLGFVHIPQRPVEVIIALSIVFVAVEIVKQRVRYGIRVAGYKIRDSRFGIRDTSYGIGDEDPGSRISHHVSCNADIASRILYPASCLSPPASSGLTVRKPWIVAFTFGLLHGLGFAGGLSEVGLPQGHIPLALLFFSAGVETGHLLFVVAVLALMWLGDTALTKIRDARYGSREAHPASSISRLVSRIPHCESGIVLVSAYAIGSAAMFWVIQRVAAF